MGKIRAVGVPDGAVSEDDLGLQDDEGNVVVRLVDEQGNQFVATPGDRLELVENWQPGDETIVVRRVVN